MVDTGADRRRNESTGEPDKWSGRSRGGGAGYRFFIFLIRNAGLRAAYCFLAFVVVYFIPFAPRATSASWFYHRRILGYGRLRAFRSLFMHFYRFGQTIIDRIAISAGMQDRFRFEFSDYDEFLKILDSGSGVVMIGAHAGSWEAGSQFFGDYAGRMNIVLYDAEYEKIKQALERNSAGPGFKVIAVNDDGLENIIRIKRALDDGEYICFQGDRYVNEDAAIEAEFMGCKARFPRGPFLVASRMRVPVVFYYSMRGEGRSYKFHFVRSQAATDGRTSERQLLEEYLTATEKIVREYPEQWFNFYKFWE